jgi:hypothetical protein
MYDIIEFQRQIQSATNDGLRIAKFDTGIKETWPRANSSRKLKMMVAVWI